MAGKAHYSSKTDWLGVFFLNHCFISTSLSVSLILYFSFWQVNQEAVAKSSIVRGTLATHRHTAVPESCLVTRAPFCPGCHIPESCSCWLPWTLPCGFVLRMSQWPACRWHPTIEAGTDFQPLCCLYWFFPYLLPRIVVGSPYLSSFLSPCIGLLLNHSGSGIRKRSASLKANPRISRFLWTQILPWAAWPCGSHWLLSHSVPKLLSPPLSPDFLVLRNAQGTTNLSTVP